eukprot:CAMPEP_0183310946 /NCGR_PEP_ID=MMETSP0160_2-20130417/34307_1 /TAXON_ID=2839 ORGANISM="Odontella Sinensis, Strain Grunow 1884" /NCGR_SAMPLE_ID=MMETSP0160_2 /ASSEMBLY_ACC=CAM_ASM_000250 /LENGTH=220 /DNA_ID=CAMNT_0025475375 /DNA_START=1 /DNA_END=663 /DNA_ORIENTATION=+
MDRKRRVEALAEREGVDAEELKFATWLVESRSMNVLAEEGFDEAECDDANEDEGEEADADADADFLPSTRCLLVPLLDMVNHSSDEPNAELQVLSSDGADDNNGDSTDYLAIVATRPVSVGEEITISYGTGADSSIELLLHYGFIPFSNQYDVEMYDFSYEEEEEDLIYDEEGFETSLAEDEKMLMGELGISERDTTILNFRIQMKRALKEWKETQESGV